jgi:hypothetical protein
VALVLRQDQTGHEASHDLAPAIQPSPADRNPALVYLGYLPDPREMVH